MRVILLFALFGLSFGSGGNNGNGGTTCPVNPKAEVHNCLIQALTEFEYLLPAIGKYVCAFNKFQEDKNADNYNAGAHEFIDVLEKLLVAVGETGSETLKVGLNILQTLGIDEPKAKLICLLAGKLLQSPCLKAALVNIASDILANLTKLYCKLKKSDTTDSDAAVAVAAAGLPQLLGNLGCVLGKELGLKDEDLEKALKDLGRDLLEKLFFYLFLAGKVDLINVIVCAMLLQVSSPTNLTQRKLRHVGRKTCCCTEIYIYKTFLMISSWFLQCCFCDKTDVMQGLPLPSPEAGYGSPAEKETEPRSLWGPQKRRTRAMLSNTSAQSR